MLKFIRFLSDPMTGEVLHVLEKSAPIVDGQLPCPDGLVANEISIDADEDIKARDLIKVLRIRGGKVEMDKKEYVNKIRDSYSYPEAVAAYHKVRDENPSEIPFEE